jgi:hypothetical protein
MQKCENRPPLVIKSKYIYQSKGREEEEARVERLSFSHANVVVQTKTNISNDNVLTWQGDLESKY